MDVRSGFFFVFIICRELCGTCAFNFVGWDGTRV